MKRSIQILNFILEVPRWDFEGGGGINIAENIDLSSMTAQFSHPEAHSTLKSSVSIPLKPSVLPNIK